MIAIVHFVGLFWLVVLLSFGGAMVVVKLLGELFGFLFD